MTNEIEMWAFTFGYGTDNRNNFVVLEGTFEETRVKMFEIYGNNWAFQYPWKSFLKQITEYNLSEIQPPDLEEDMSSQI